MQIPEALKVLGATSFVDINKIEIQYQEDTGDTVYLCLRVSGVSTSFSKHEEDTEVFFTLFPLRIEGGDDTAKILVWDSRGWSLQAVNALNGRGNWIEIDLNQEGNFIKFHN